MTVPNRISIVTLGVADLDRATAFYESLGWTKSSASMPTITLFEMVGPVFGL
jgi:catechol 2,3-dioxygenase-like lactoylglutathione lyase family enzyme